MTVKFLRLYYSSDDYLGGRQKLFVMQLLNSYALAYLLAEKYFYPKKQSNNDS